jgi:hypothetical protein
MRATVTEPGKNQRDYFYYPVDAQAFKDDNTCYLASRRKAALVSEPVR